MVHTYHGTYLKVCKELQNFGLIHFLNCEAPYVLCISTLQLCYRDRRLQRLFTKHFTITVQGNIQLRMPASSSKAAMPRGARHITVAPLSIQEVPSDPNRWAGGGRVSGSQSPSPWTPGAGWKHASTASLPRDDRARPVIALATTDRRRRLL